MNLSVNWLRDYLSFDYSVEQLSEILTAIGLEVAKVHSYSSVKGGLEGVVIGKVLTKKQHENADRLSVTTVDLGGDEPVQIVCGAPNVDAGQTVVVATVGAMLYPESGDPFAIKKSKIRGESSYGMICAEDELGLGQSHDGIMVLDDAHAAGTPAADVLDIYTDTIIEIDLTPNRGDATSHYGVARDLAAYMRVHQGFEGKIALPESTLKIPSSGTTISVEVKDEAACPRYAGLVIEGLEVKESPAWLQNRLKAIGLTPKNNIVDATNYILHGIGQPLHAFDLDHVKGGIIVETKAEGTSFVTLDGEERKLRASDLMICNAEGEPMCIAGVYGGQHSGVTESTKAIFLESAHFSARSIRGTMVHHNLRTDAARIFEKGSDPNVCVEALHVAAALILEIAGGSVVSPITDVYPQQITGAEIDVKFDYLRGLIGADMPDADIQNILAALEIKTSAIDGGVKAIVPTDKSEVTRPCDIVEEVLRIYGYDTIEMSSKVNASLVYTDGINSNASYNRAANLLTGAGFNEMMSLSIVPSKVFAENAAWNVAQESLVKINNTSSRELDAMRPNLLISMLDAVKHNTNYRNADLRLFEFGRSYAAQDDAFVEKQQLALAMTGRLQAEAWNTADAQSSFYELKGAVEMTLTRLGVSEWQQEATALDGAEAGLVIKHKNAVIAEMMLVSHELLKQYGIDVPVYYATIDWKAVRKISARSQASFVAPSKFPSLRRDLALVVDTSVQFAQVEQLARKTIKKELRDVNLFDVYEDESRLGKGKKSYAVSFVLQDDKKTLRDKDADKMLNKLKGTFRHQLGASIRGEDD